MHCVLFKCDNIVFLQVKTIRLVGILLMVFVKNKHMLHISEVDAETVATGIMGLMVRKKSFFV